MLLGDGVKGLIPGSHLPPQYPIVPLSCPAQCSPFFHFLPFMGGRFHLKPWPDSLNTQTPQDCSVSPLSQESHKKTCKKVTFFKCCVAEDKLWFCSGCHWQRSVCAHNGETVNCFVESAGTGLFRAHICLRRPSVHCGLSLLRHR